MAEELLHTVIEGIYSSGTAPQVCAKGEIHAYVVTSIKNAWINRASAFWKGQPQAGDQVTDAHASAPDITMRLINETADSLVSRLPEIEAELMRLHVLPDFDYDELSAATGVPKKYLYSRIEKAKMKLRRYVNSSKPGDLG